ncbi:hypothetical protein ACIA8G_01710 [Lentzea sp. NPDC051213]|uniref:hypothetical protein n=1 Tax=Lentzea sp. NPDC051213 TaxID=3364126 RepID=UPI0037968414
MTDALRPVEQSLIEHVERGELLDLAGDSPVDVESMRSWDESRTIRAWVIRDILRGRLAPDPDPLGLRLRGARIEGRLSLGNVISTVWLELYSCLLDEGMSARDARLAGIALSGCRLEHPTGHVLSACRLTASMLWIDQGTTVEGHTAVAVDLSGARLDELHCEGARFSSDAGTALDLHSAKIEENVRLHNGFEAVGVGAGGAIRLVGTEIGGTLDLDGARLHNDSGPAMNAEGLQTGRNVLLRHGFSATGAGEDGAVDLSAARITGMLNCNGATLRNDSGPALLANEARVDLYVFWNDGFDAHGVGPDGCVSVPGSHFGGWECQNAIMRNPTGPALSAVGLRVDNHVGMEDFRAFGGGEDAVIILNIVEIRGAFSFQPSQLEHLTDPRSRISVDELVYRGIPFGIHASEWLTYLREGTPYYAAQPYQHLAAAHRAAGHDREARRILMEQRRDQIDRGLTGRGERVWARFTGLVLGYGYQPWRALVGLLAVLITGAVLAVALGGTGLVQTRAGAAPTPCPMIDRIAVGLELGAPLLSTPARIRCEATNTGAGQALTITGWVLRLMAWAFATLFIAGFTGAVRKT